MTVYSFQYLLPSVALPCFLNHRTIAHEAIFLPTSAAYTVYPLGSFLASSLAFGMPLLQAQSPLSFCGYLCL